VEEIEALWVNFFFWPRPVCSAPKARMGLFAMCMCATNLTPRNILCAVVYYIISFFHAAGAGPKFAGLVFCHVLEFFLLFIFFES